MAFAIGISVDEFKHMTPYKLECCLKGHRMNRKMHDEEMWLWWREYGISAFIYAIAHTFGKNSKFEYAEEPVFSRINHSGTLTEEEKERELQLFIKRNEKMRAEWKRKKHKQKNEVE